MSTAYIAPISWGLGDLVVSLPAVQGLIKQGQETYLVTRSALQEGLADRIEGLAGSIAEKSLAASNLPATHKYYNLRAHRLQTDYWWGTPEFKKDYPHYRINEILQHICVDLGIPANFHKIEPLLYKKRPDFAGKAVFLPGSDGNYKCWTSSQWMQLFSFLQVNGQAAVIIGQPERSQAVQMLVQIGIPWLPTPTLADALDALSSCSFVVGVDTGLMHMAVQQGTPTIALFRQDPIYLRSAAHAFSLIADPCPSECIQKSYAGATNEMVEFKEWQPSSWSCQLPDHQRCMASISTAAVIQLLSKQGLLGNKASKR